MKYTFTAYGHQNILATHRTTLEITKDSELTKKGDCIAAVKADFSLQRIKEVIGSCGGSNYKIQLTIAAAGIKEKITAVANKNFGSDHEIVLRKGEFASERTLGIHADKAAAGLNRRMVEKLRSSTTAISVTIETHETHNSAASGMRKSCIGRIAQSAAADLRYRPRVDTHHTVI